MIDEWKHRDTDECTLNDNEREAIKREIDRIVDQSIKERRQSVLNC